MTRISDLGLSQALLSGYQRAQAGAEARQIQLSTGKVSPTYGGLGAQAPTLLTAEGVRVRAAAFEQATNIAATRLQLQESSLSNISDSVARLRGQFVVALSSGGAELLPGAVGAEAQRILSALNISSGGVFLFGGDDGSIAPVAARTLEDLVGAANVDSLFQTNARTRLPIENGVSVDGGATARDVGLELASELAAIGQAFTALGPFSGALTDAQRQFLVDQVSRLDSISATLFEELGLNGQSQGQVEDARIRNVRQRDLAEVVAAEIEDADLAEVISRLAQDRLAVEASGRALAEVSQLSLLNFL